MPKVTKTIEVDGEEREVEVDVSPEELGDSVVTKDEFKSRLSEERAKVRRAEREKASDKFSLDELTSNEELLEELRDRNPDLFASPNGDGEEEAGGGLTEDDLERFQEKWKREHVKPLQERLDELQGEAERLRVEKLRNEVLEAANEVDVRSGLRRALFLEYRDRMEYSPEEGGWFLKDGDDFEISTSDGDNRYVTVEEDIRQRKESGDLAPDWFESSTREGAGFGGTDSGGGSPQSSIDEMSEQERMEFIDEHGLEAYREAVRKAYASS